jgi:hypothetical protein
MIRQVVDDVVLADFLDPIVTRSQPVVELTHPPPPPLRLKPAATHKIEALAERYLNGSQRILDN